MNRVLFVDDDTELLDKLKGEFEANHIEVITCQTLDEATAAIEDDIPFDIVILDWFFDTDDSVLSRTFLSQIKNRHFRPVFVFTNNLTDYEQTDSASINFPANLLRAVAKDTGIERLRAAMEEMLTQNISLQLASLYRNNIKDGIEQVLFDLNELPNGDLAVVLKAIIGDEKNIDWSNDFILNLIHRYLLADNFFIADLNRILEIARPVTNRSAADKRWLINKMLYFQPVSHFIRNGDIVHVKSENGAVDFFGIVTTPDCDLVQPNSRFIEIVELKKIGDTALGLTTDTTTKVKKHNHPSLYFFPSVEINNELIDFVAILKAKVVVEEVTAQTTHKFPLASTRLLYSHGFKIRSHDVRIEFICGSSNPYKSEFSHRLHVSNSRVGIPDIVNLVD